MQVRLASDELNLLYTTGDGGQLSVAVVRSFFRLLEAIEAAADLTDLNALRSLAMVDIKEGYRFALADGFVCTAALYADKQGQRGLAFAALPVKT